MFSPLSYLADDSATTELVSVYSWDSTRAQRRRPALVAGYHRLIPISERAAILGLFALRFSTQLTGANQLACLARPKPCVRAATLHVWQGSVPIYWAITQPTVRTPAPGRMGGRNRHAERIMPPALQLDAMINTTVGEWPTADGAFVEHKE